MFLTVPLFQFLFPEISLGALVGNMKVGSLFRSVGSTIMTHPSIYYVQNIKLAVLALVGTVIGASFISNLDQVWVLPALIMAVLVAVFAPKIAPYVSARTFHVMSFFSGVNAGVFGAGIGVILLALLRFQYPDDTDIGVLKIQARFVEFLLVIVAVIAHFFHGNLIFSIWFPWSCGAVAGGVVGGILLNKLGKLPGTLQKWFLYASFVIAIALVTLNMFKVL